MLKNGNAMIGVKYNTVFCVYNVGNWT